MSLLQWRAVLFAQGSAGTLRPKHYLKGWPMFRRISIALVLLMAAGAAAAVNWQAATEYPATAMPGQGLLTLARLVGERTNGAVQIVPRFDGPDGLRSASIVEAVRTGRLEVVYLVKLDANGLTVWARTAASGANDGVFGIAARSDGSFVASGYFADAYDHTLTFADGQTGPVSVTAPADKWETGWVASFDAQGRVGWVRMLGGSSREDKVRECCVREQR